MRALYRIPDERKPDNQGNAGLWYDKYCDKWIEKPEEGGKLLHWTLDKNKSEWIKSVTHKKNSNTIQPGKVGANAELKEACDRQRQIAIGMGVDDEEVQLFSTQWRFVTGLGREHPVENGFAWHHTLGTPYLPGSSVKGMVRAWAEQWEDKPKPAMVDVDRIFGPRGKGEVGNVVFFDALPDGSVLLEADIMTPHYGPWYAGGEAPGDWHDPNPIPFLAVAANQTFQFIIAPRRPDDEQSLRDAKTSRIWLKEALEWIGAGAKTAVGYGRFGEVGGAAPAIEEERWENANLRYEPGPGTLVASLDGKSASGNNNNLKEWVENQRESNAGKKKLNKGQIKRDVVVRQRGNSYDLMRIIEDG